MVNGLVKVQKLDISGKLRAGNRMPTVLIEFFCSITGEQQLTPEQNGTAAIAPYHSDPKLPKCPMIPPGLHGTVKTITVDVPDTMEELESLFPYLLPGGRFHPEECTARHRVAIVVPYRDREDHLRTFLLNIHKFLRPQQLDYAIYLGKTRLILFYFPFLIWTPRSGKQLGGLRPVDRLEVLPGYRAK